MPVFLSRFIQMMFALSLTAALVGCAPPPLEVKGTVIEDASMGGDFSLTDHHGKPQSLAAYKGKVVALFFGYTHCPDVCPTTMLEYASVMKQLGADAAKVQVLFISVDPKRDTPQVLAGYVPHFNPAFVGLTGSEEAIAKVSKQYKVVAQQVPTPGGSYSVDHSAGSYLLDKEGRLRVFEAYGTSAANLTYDIRQLLR